MLTQTKGHDDFVCLSLGISKLSQVHCHANVPDINNGRTCMDYEITACTSLTTTSSLRQSYRNA